jgi:hypothetical protein
MAFIKSLVFITLCCLSLAYQANDFSFETKEDVYVIGDIHGAYDELVMILSTAKLIDAQQNWIGGKTHLVSLGDLLDRGPRSRAVIDLLRKLQQQADDAGGKVHVILGNHEVMILQGDWRYLSKEEIAEFAAEENDRERRKAYEIFLRSFRLEDSEANQAKFDAEYPAGFFAHMKAFNRRGDYGEWILEQPFLLKINNNLFTHGGLSHRVEGMSLEEINEVQKDDLEDYLKVWEYYIREQVLSFNVPFFQRPEFVEYARDDRHKRKFMSTHESLVFSTFSTTWYRGNALCHPYFEDDRLKAQLRDMNADRLWVGHTTTISKQVEKRLTGSLIIMDTGMLADYYRGQPWIGRIQPNDKLSFIHGKTGELGEPLQSAVRAYVNPYRWSDEQVEEFLKTAEVVELEKTEEGRTNPLRLTMRDGKHEIKGIFKYRDSEPLSERLRWKNSYNEADRYQYEMAAYKLDRMLGIGLVPVTVEREINGKKGIVQLWIDNLTSYLQMNEQALPYDGMCELAEQINFIDSFDYLIANRDRNQSNILFSKSDLQIWFIDHSRAFGTGTRRPEMLKKSAVKPSKRFLKAIKSLDKEKLQVLRPWLHEKQVEAILKRRDKMLSGKF